MATIRLPNDFSEFLRLLNSNGAEYLLVGGYAVNYYGYSRSTGDLDVWISPLEQNRTKVAKALQQFGFASTTPEMFGQPDQVVRMGVPPLRLEILTSISGVEFADCYRRREIVDIAGLAVPVIRLDDLIRNKRAAGRLKDLADLEQLE